MAFSVPFADGRPLPLNVLEKIAFHVVAAPPSSTPSVASAGLNSHPYLYDPPQHLPPSLATAISRLPPLLAVSKSVYEALSPGIATSKENGAKYPLKTELYARLCCEFLDVKAAGRRWRGTTRRNRTNEDDADAWDKDVRGVPNAALTAHLVQVCRSLRFLVKAAKEMDIPLPAQVLSEARKESNTKGALYNPAIENVLISMVVLMMENDGKNHHQLRLVSAPLFVDMLVFHRLNEGTATPLPGPGGIAYRYNDGWPVENVLNTAAVWLLWLFTTPEKITSETRPVRERLISLVLPFVLCPYRYASALVPPTHFTLPLLGDTDDVFTRPCSSTTAHGSYPVYHAYPFNDPTKTTSSPTPATADATPTATTNATAMTNEAAAAAPRIIAGQRVEEDPSNDNARPAPPPHEAASNGPSTNNAAAGTAAAPNIRDPNAPGGSTAPPVAGNTNSRSPSPRGSSASRVVSVVSMRPPPVVSNSQAHPSYGVRFPWYCSPYEDGTDEVGEVGEGMRHREVSARTPSETSRAGSRSGSRSVSMDSSSCFSSSSSESFWISTPNAVDAVDSKQRMIVLYLPLITASAKLVFMSRREAIPLPVLPHLPVDREAARRLQRPFAGPTQADMREVGQWCTWGRRAGVGVVAAPATGVAASTTTPATTTATVATASPSAPNAQPENGPVDEDDDGMRYKDSQRWDVDWWRMRVCGGRQWFSPLPPPSSTVCTPSSSSASLPFLPSPPLSPSLLSDSLNNTAYRMGTVYEKGMLTGLWQGYMHIPAESSLNYLVHNRFFANNFSEAMLGVMMRPIFMRLEEHVWVPTVKDPGRFGAKAALKAGGYEKEGYYYEDVGPWGHGPVPAARPSTMLPTRGIVEDVQQRTGFLDQNMNNAWIPGPVASFKYEEGYTTPEGRQMKAEDGVSDGVFRDRILQAQHQAGKQKMKGITMVVPDTYAPSEGIPWYPPGHPLRAGGAAAPAAAPIPNANPAAVAGVPNARGSSPGLAASAPATARLDNPNNPGHNILPVDEGEEARVVVKGRKHVYETYHPPPYTAAARNSDRERESVHERMERAKGGEVCKGSRRLRRRRLEEDDNDNVDMERGLEGPGPVEEYVYAHPGCLKCREREEVVKARVEEERQKKKRRARILWEKRRKEMEDMFASVGLGREGIGRRDEFEDEDDDEKDVILDLDLDSEDVDMDEGEELEEEEEDDDGEDDDMLSVITSESDGDDDDEDVLDPDDVRSIERDIPSCDETAEDIIVTGGMDDRHAEAWGRFVYYGRVRPWDGLIGIVRMGVSPDNAGSKFFFYGYIYGGKTFVGNWRYAAADAVVPSVESSFVFSRRADV